MSNDFDASKVRKIQKDTEKKDLKDIVEYHYKKVCSLVQFHKKDKRLFYMVNSFIPGFRNYNPTPVTDKLIVRLKKDLYGVKRFSDMTFEVSWRLSNKDQMKKYVRKLVTSVYEHIKECIKDGHYSLTYNVPINFRYPPDKTKELLVGVLRSKKFTVVESGNVISITW